MMKTRMQPIGNAWTKLPRIVRDLAKSLGKDIRLEMEGRETELDRSLIEAIKDPLLHLVRNSVDHGIESPADRITAGKDPRGTLFLSAYHESGQVNIDIVDDGRGIDLAKIRAKALEQHLYTPEQLAQLSEREVLNLIFHPGLSTAEKVSNISGRGVGMDVARSNIERIGGSIDIHSEPGHGTSIKLKIPLTLAIIPALMVGSGGERFAIPQLSLQELVRLEGRRNRRKGREPL
jgi:two-component system, chemotaxis family, sensor kinase CheA